MLVFALLACHGPADSDTGVAPPVLGEPITAPAGEWTWVDVDGTACDDGSTTGLAINPGTSTNLLVFMMGGGACWDYVTCFTVGTASHGPFGAEEWSDYPPALGGSIFDRGDANNPFADWSYVFVPYCTGDLHGGDGIVTYTQGDNARDYHHTGHSNIVADLARVAPTFPNPGRVVVSGASAGGGGTLMNYPTFRWYWPDVPMNLLDDSLPLLQGDAIQPWLRETWTASWNLNGLLDDLCPDCETDFSRLHVALGERWPNDRMALLTSEEDETISGYLLMSGERYKGYLHALDEDVFATSPTWKRFFVAGDGHTMIGNPARHETAAGDELWPWLTQMVTDDPAWASVGP